MKQDSGKKQDINPTNSNNISLSIKGMIMGTDTKEMKAKNMTQSTIGQTKGSKKETILILTKHSINTNNPLKRTQKSKTQIF